MDLSQAFEILKTKNRITVGTQWAQGRSLFGGLTAALMLAKLQHILDKPRRLRSLTVNFVAPVNSAEPIDFTAKILRVGKSVVQGEVHLSQNDEVSAVLLAAFGEARESKAIQTATTPAPQWMPPQNLPTESDLGSWELPFMRYLDLRWVEGDKAFSSGKKAEFGAYTRFQNQSGTFTLAHLVALTDGFPPAPSVLLDHIVPVSSLTWAIELLHEPQDISLADFWQYRVKTDYTAEGYGHTEARMWDKNGVLTLISRQTVTVFG